MKIDEQITSAFDELTGASQLQTADVATIAKRAGQRRWRNRTLAASLSVAAIVGVAGLVGSPLQSDEPTAVIFANDPEPSAEIDGGIDETTDQIDDEATATRSEVGDGTSNELSPLELIESSTTVPIESKRTSAPSAQKYAFDGDGGFVGVSWGETGNSTGNIFVVSTDGETWTTSTAWDLDGYRATDLSRQGGTYVAILQSADSVKFEPENPDAPIQIALSTDLINWEHVTLETAIVLPDDIAKKLTVHTQPISASLSGETLLAQIGYWVEVQRPATGVFASDDCGTTFGDDGIQLVRCDGSVVEIIDHETWESLGLDQLSRFFVRTGEGAVREVEPPAGVHLPAVVLATNAGFVTQQPFGNQLYVSTDGETWIEGPEIPGADGELWGALSGSDGSKAAFYGAERDSALPLAVVDLDSGEVQTSSVALSTIEGTQIAGGGPGAHGPAGWVFVVQEGTPDGWGVIGSDDWFLNTRDSQAVSPTYSVTPTNSSFPRYELRRGSANVVEGLFGAIRIDRPGTDEVLVEFDSAEFAAAVSGPSGGGLASPNEAQPGTTFSHDGWTLTGDPLVGPLEVVTDEGQRVLFDDVQAPGAHSGGNGLEATIGPRGHLIFVRDGEPVWQESMTNVVSALTSPLRDTNRGRAFVLHSPNGDEWKLAAVTQPLEPRSVWDLHVGDDEVVLSQSFGVPAQTVRYRLPDDCCTAADDE